MQDRSFRRSITRHLELCLSVQQQQEDRRKRQKGENKDNGSKVRHENHF